MTSDMASAKPPQGVPVESVGAGARVAVVKLPREVAERKCGKTITVKAGQRDADEAIIEEACRSALAESSGVRLTGEVFTGDMDYPNAKLLDAPSYLPESFPEGPVDIWIAPSTPTPSTPRGEES